MPTTTMYGDISSRTAAKVERRLLKRGQALLVFERFGQVSEQPMNSTSNAKFRRYNSLVLATAPLAEGIPPAGQKLTHTDVDLTLRQYGDVLELTDVVKDTHEDPILQVMTDVCGEQAAETIEVVRYQTLRAGTNVQYAGSVASRTLVNGTLSRGDLRKIVRTLARNRARKISSIVGASEKVSTMPVEAAYFAVCHVDLEADIRNITGFVPVAQYGDSMKALPGEVGAVESIRFITTDLATPFLAAGASGTTYLSSGLAPASSAAADVYPVLIFGRDAYGLRPMQGKRNVQVSVLNPQPRPGDPLGQKGSVGWKTYQGAVILNDLWMVRYEVACTANPN